MALFGKNKKDVVTIEKAVLEICSRMHPDLGWTVDREIDAVTGGSHHINLTDLRRQYDKLGVDRRRAWCEMTIPPLLAQPARPSVDRSTLRAVIRNRAMIEGARLHAIGEGGVPAVVPHHVLTDDLCALLVIDEATSMVTVNDDMLNEWGVGFDELWPIGVSNVRDLDAPTWNRIDDGVVAAGGDDYVSSRLLLPELAESVAAASGGSIGLPLVAIPTRRTSLYVATLEDPAALAAAMRAASADLGEDSQISFWPVVLTGDGAMRRLVLDPSHPVHDTYRQLTRLDLEATYAGPSKQLTQLVGPDLTVAPVLIGVDPNGVVESYATWGDGETLIPNVDAIVFEGAGRPRMTASFADVWAHCHELMEQTDHYPARWRVRSMPDQALIERFAR